MRKFYAILLIALVTLSIAACVSAAGSSALTQHFLTGGPIANLLTLIPVYEGSDLKTANHFQCPSILCGVAMVIVFFFCDQPVCLKFAFLNLSRDSHFGSRDFGRSI